MLIKGLRWGHRLIRHTSLLACIFNTGRHVSSRPFVMETSSHVLLGCLEEKGDPRPHTVFLKANALVRPLDRALTVSGLQCFMGEAGGPGCRAQEGTGRWLALRCDLTWCYPEVSHDAPSPPHHCGLRLLFWKAEWPATLLGLTSTPFLLPSVQTPYPDGQTNSNIF